MAQFGIRTTSSSGPFDKGSEVDYGNFCFTASTSIIGQFSLATVNRSIINNITCLSPVLVRNANRAMIAGTWATTTLARRAALAVTTVPTNSQCWWQVAGITVGTTVAAGLAATVSGFVDPIQDLDLSPIQKHWWKPISALFFPALVEEILWRGLWIPHPSLMATHQTPYGFGLHSALLNRRAGIVLVVHVLSHPIAGWTVWPRGKKVFCDPRFLLLATIVLGGSTLSYLASGGSAWAAAITHGIPVALWRDCWGGEAKLMAILGEMEATTISSKKD